MAGVIDFGRPKKVQLKSMRRLFSLATVICFSVWILPLGNFIKLSEEKTACGGNRAFHMCSMMTPKVHPVGDSQKVTFTSTSGVEKTQKSAAAGGNDFFSAASFAGTPDLISKFSESDLIFPSKVFYFSIDPVPKV